MINQKLFKCIHLDPFCPKIHLKSWILHADGREKNQTDFTWRPFSQIEAALEKPH